MKRLCKTIIDEYIYESEEEKEKHRAIMESKGYMDSGQLKVDINRSFINSDYRWYGKYTKYIV